MPPKREVKKITDEINSKVEEFLYEWTEEQTVLDWYDHDAHKLVMAESNKSYKRFLDSEDDDEKGEIVGELVAEINRHVYSFLYDQCAEEVADAWGDDEMFVNAIEPLFVRPKKVQAKKVQPKKSSEKRVSAYTLFLQRIKEQQPELSGADRREAWKELKENDPQGLKTLEDDAKALNQGNKEKRECAPEKSGEKREGDPMIPPNCQPIKPTPKSVGFTKFSKENRENVRNYGDTARQVTAKLKEMWNDLAPYTQWNWERGM